MKKLSLLVITGLVAFNSQAQIDSSNIVQVNLKPDAEKDPIVLIYHSMGDVDVQGHIGDDVFVYAEEFLPSAEWMFSRDRGQQSEFFSYFNEQTGNLKQINRNDNFLITEEDNIVQIRTSRAKFNMNVEVMVPLPSSVKVNVEQMGNVNVENIDGDVEASTFFGSVRVANTKGSVLASSRTGTVIGDFSEVRVENPIYLTTFVGNVEIIVPREAKSSLQLYSEMGQFYSNFDDNILNKVNAEVSTHSRPSQRNKVSFNINGGGTNSNFVAKTVKGDIYLRHNE